jgi:chromosome partitioning protein
MALILSLANQKGGVSKTTSVVNVAYALAKRGKRVLAVDMDPQSSLTVYFGQKPYQLEEQQQTIYWCLQAKGSNIQSVIIPGEVDLLPASIQLEESEKEFFFDLNSGSILKKKLTPLDDLYDFILIDCRPTLTLLTMNALVASDAVLIPVKTDLLSIMGIPLLLKRIYDLQQSENPRLAILGILPTMYNAQNVHDREAVEELRKSVPSNIHFFDPINRRHCSTVLWKLSNSLIHKELPRTARLSEVFDIQRLTGFPVVFHSSLGQCPTAVPGMIARPLKACQLWT